MATSVILKACGGIGPYTWSKTGNVQLSATEGIEVTVTASGSGGTSTNFYITFSTGTLSCTSGDCATYGAGGAIGLSGSPNFQIRTTDCSGGTVTSGCTVNAPNLTCGSTNINCGDCSGTLVVTCVGSCTGSGCSASSLSDNITLTCGSNSGSLDHTTWLSGRQEYLIINGGGSVIGSTVTVTDHAGISVTYTF